MRIERKTFPSNSKVLLIMIYKTSAMKCLLQLVFKSKSNTLRLGLSFPLLVICHIKIVKYINKKNKFLKLIIYIIEINIENS